MEVAILPTMALLVDLRHTSNYSGVYAITDIALSLGYALGPLCGGALARAIGFPWISVIFGIILIVYSPLFILLRNPPGKEEIKPILPQDNQTLPTNTSNVKDKLPDPHLKNTGNKETH
ncbi:hypothetical protein GDO86_006724 [Hymenochirus boettgeri]|uniref:Uncharacterized protein n=1 Tax=Hymenochirus boettgeri TaxID=247094 RepID=A0A8T2J781_9PIPI|nr:hypothetical protein GDO86_006724 [Hymenochirus boettgeri]